MIHVTKTHLPKRETFDYYVSKLFSSGWLTNDGELCQRFESKLQDYLGVKHLVLVSNGGMALHLAYKLLQLQGEVITTPFSYVATTSTLVWDGLKPVYSDIDDSYNLDPSLIEEKITKQTSAILPVHTFGNPCDINNIRKIANRHNLKVIYDAAHCFGIEHQGTSILNEGDISILSFHATKLFHSIEGGALVLNNSELYERAKRMRTYGYQAGEIKGLGINARMNEFSAAMGLAVLDDIDFIMEKRRSLWRNYHSALAEHVKMLDTPKETKFNHQYVPIVLKDSKQRARVEASLNKIDIYPRRYFYPSLDTLEYVPQNQICPVSRDTADRILCLPIYPDLTLNDQNRIIKTTLEAL